MLYSRRMVRIGTVSLGALRLRSAQAPLSRALVVALLLLGPMGASPAVADEISPPPPSCPPGSSPHSEHAGEWCAASTCTSDADCTEAASPVCREVALCVVEEQYALGGNIAADPPPTRTRRVAHGECVDGACPAGGVCGRVRRCAPPLGAPGSAPGSGPASSAREEGGCSVSRGSAAPWLLALAALTTLWGSRRR